MAESGENVPTVTITDAEDDANINYEKSEDDQVDGETENPDLLQPKKPIRHSKVLQDLDSKHAWLSELEITSDFISKTQYVALSNQFQSTLDEMEGDDNLIVASLQFSKLFEKFRLAYMGSQKLLNKVKELQLQKNFAEADNEHLRKKLANQKMDSEGRCQRALELLNKELSEAQNALGELGTEKRDLERELEILKEDLSREPIDVEEVTVPIIAIDDDDQRKIEALEVSLEMAQNEGKFAMAREAKVRDRLQKVEQEKHVLQTEISKANSGLQREANLRETAERLVEEANKKHREAEATIKTLTIEVGSMKTEIETEKSISHRLQVDIKDLNKKLDTEFQETAKLKRDVSMKEDRITKTTLQKDAIDIELKASKMEIHSLKQDISGANKEKRALASKVVFLEEKVKELDKKFEQDAVVLARLQKDVHDAEKVKADLSQKNTYLNKIKDNLHEDIKKLEDTMSQLKIQLYIAEDKCLSLDKAVCGFKKDIENLQDVIKQNVRVKERMATEALNLQKKNSEFKQELQIMSNRLTQEEKTSTRLRAQLAQEFEKNKNMYDDLRTMRKQSADEKADMIQLKDKMVVLNSYAEQLKGLVRGLENEVAKAKSANHHLETDHTAMKETLKQQRKAGVDLGTRLKHQENHSQMLLKQLAEREQELEASRRKLVEATDERDALGSRLVERTREATSKGEQLRLMEVQQTRRDEAIAEREKDVELLRMELSRMQREKVLMAEQAGQFNTVRNELGDTQRNLLEERMRTKAIEEDSQRPLNLHRWRILEGTDPDRAELLAKNRGIQKQLLSSKAELDAKELVLREKERLVEELRLMLRRRSETRLAEKYAECKRVLRERTDKLKCKTTEVNMYQKVCDNYKVQLEKLQGEVDRFRMSKRSA